MFFNIFYQNHCQLLRILDFLTKKQITKLNSIWEAMLIQAMMTRINTGELHYYLQEISIYLLLLGSMTLWF